MSLAFDTIVEQQRPTQKPKEREPVRWKNLAVGAFMNLFQVTTLGQPMEVLKTYVAANRQDTLRNAVRQTWLRGGFTAFYQGLIPWAWIEASTKGAILVLTSTEVERQCKSRFNANPATAGVLGGMAGGSAQAYLTMGMTTCMKTVEVTRTKTAVGGGKPAGTMEVFFQILRTKGIRGINKGVNAVALRQITGWSSRIGISRVAESQIRLLGSKSADQKLSFGEKVAASTIGGALSCWNQPFEVCSWDAQVRAS